MERREKILLVGLVIAAGLVAYYYSGSYMSYLGLGGKDKAKESKPAMKMVKDTTSNNAKESSSSVSEETTNPGIGKKKRNAQRPPDRRMIKRSRRRAQTHRAVGTPRLLRDRVLPRNQGLPIV